MSGVDVYDAKRDARTFQGGCPVIAHPPCRSWSAFCAHQAKAEPGERELAMFCARAVQEWGGILEQPAHSRLWVAAGLPKPGTWDGTADSWSAEVWQAWWGYPMRKATWLYFSLIPPSIVRYPLRLHPRGGDRRAEQVMSKQQRSATPEAMAAWLVDLARQAKAPMEATA